MSGLTKIILGFTMAVAGTAIVALGPPPWMMAGFPFVVIGLLLIDNVAMN